MHQISASSPSLVTPCHHTEESDGGGGGSSSGSFRDFMSAPACLMPPPPGFAGTFASEKDGCDNNSGSTTTAVRRKNNQISGSADAQQQQQARSYGERRSGTRSRRTLQEQELRELLEAAVNQSTSSSSMPEGADVDMPDSPVSGSRQLVTANAADTVTAADKGQHSGDALTTDPAGGGGGGGGGAAAGSFSHPVVELYRSIGQPLDQASFEELKRRVKSTMGKDGAGASSMSELEDFVGDLNRSSEGVLEGGAQKDSPSPPPPAAAMEEEEEEEEEEEVVSVGEDCDAMEGVEQGGGGGGGFEDSGIAEQQQCCDAAGPPAGAAPSAPGSLSEVILKFTTVADGNEASSFTVKRGGATVGRGSCNDICIPNDSCMGESEHASIVWREGAFHVEDRGLPYGASVRIGTGRGVRDWPLDQGAMFSAGNSVFHTTEIDEDKGMLLEIVAGPLKGQKRRVHKDGANIGRATESTISIADRELSRNHSTIECDDNAQSLSSSGWASSGDGGADAGGGDDRHSADAKKDGTLDLSTAESVDGSSGQGEAGGGRMEYYLCDVGSTNGTYVQLVGPYANSRRLELSDHILIGRTGFSINRYDWGVWEDRGARRSMEDKSVVIQDMGVESLTSLGLGPQTFLAVYDGHGGGEASTFLWQRLHVAIAEALEDSTSRIEEALQQDRAAERLATFGSSGGGGQATRCDDWDGGATTPAGGGWTPSAVFSSSNGGPTPPNPSVESLLHALAMAASSGAGSEDEPRSGEGVAGRSELRWGYDTAPACMDSGESSPRRPPVLSTAPSLPPEWLFGAREVVANSACSDEAAAAAAAAAPTGVEEEGPQHDAPPRSGASSDTGSDGEAAAAAGGDAASGVCTETAGGRQAEDPRRQEADGGAGGEEETFGVASKPPLPSGSGRQSGAQSPGGGPSRPLASAGLPAEGGGGAVAREGMAKQKAPTAVDRVIEDVVTAAFLATDEEFLTTASKPSSGSTATTAMVLGDRFYGFNVGDSRTILCRAGRAEVVSKDHKPSREDETERIKRAGGMVIQRRVMGELAVSRAFGDRAFKVGIKAILREDSGHQHGSDLDDDLDEDEDEDDGLNHTAPPTGSPTNGGDAAEALAADHNSRTMGRGSSSGQLLPPPPPVVPPPSMPAAPPSAPPPPPPAPPAATAGVSRAKPVTDPTGALITAEPEMLSCRITPEDEFVLLACDGLFDVFTSDEVVRIVRKELRMHGDTQRVCETLVRKAINERYTQDNVSVVLVVLKKFW